MSWTWGTRRRHRGTRPPEAPEPTSPRLVVAGFAELQLDLALEAQISTRHLSFVETRRAKPGAEMVLRLAEQLDVPLRERNELLLAGGYAPAHGSRDLDEPLMDSVRDALDRPAAQA